MMKKRNQYSAEFKFKVAMEATKAQKTVNQLAVEPDEHPNRVSQWKRQLLEEGAAVFNGRTVGHPREPEAQEAEWYEQIGRLKMELEWLNKKAARFS